MADGNSGLQTRGRVAAFAGPSLALPRVLQHNVIGCSHKQPAEQLDHNAMEDCSRGSRKLPPLRRGQVHEQHHALKESLTEIPQFLDSPAAQEAAGRCKEVKAAIAQRQQGNNRVTQQAVELTEQEQFGEDVMRLAIDNNWSFHFVEHATTQAFFEKWLPHLKLPSRKQMAIEDKLELPSFRQHIDQVKEVVHYFLHLQLPRELLLQHRAATAAAAATTTTATTVSAKQVELALRSVAISDSLGHDARSRNVIALVLNPDFWEKNEWIVGTLAPAAKLVEAFQADAANLAHVHFGQMAIEDKLDKITRSCPPAFQDDAFDLEQAWDQRMLYGHHPALCLAAVIDPNFRDKHGALLPDQMRNVEDLAARLASSNGQGGDSAAAQARDEFHTRCSDGYMVKMNLSTSIFHPRLLRDPVTWWEWYGKKTPVLQQVAQRVLSIPATLAGVERLFSVFKFIWSDRRSRLLTGRMWAMAYVYFNTRALKHQEQPMADDAADVARWEEWMASQPVEGAPL
ncbi:hypothetical protein QJQ45_010146 [Haematococcus lacustris]|nr:hypothetical protein QJQ45_010146 [Haematococcus lacustris]